MKRYISTVLFTVLFIFFINTVLAQEDFNNSRHTISEIINHESNFNSILVDTVEFGLQEYSDDKSGKGISTISYIFDRVNDKFIPRLHVWYHFDSTSDALVAVNYSWGLYNPSFDANKNRPLLEKLVSEEKVFQKKFMQIFKDLKKEFGSESHNKILVDAEHAYIKTITWELEDKIIELSISFTRKLQEFPGIGLATNHFNIKEFIRFK